MSAIPRVNADRSLRCAAFRTTRSARELLGKGIIWYTKKGAGARTLALSVAEEVVGEDPVTSQIAAPHISLMSQYHPTHKAYKYKVLSRPISISEHAEALKVMTEVGLVEGWAQDIASHKHYLPDFERKNHPFDSKV